MFMKNKSIINDTAVTFDRVTFAYNQGDEVFRDTSLTIPNSSFFFLTGESGAGKSSLLKLIYKANNNYLGSLQVMGQELKKITEKTLPMFRRKIGVVFQEFHLFDHLSTIDNVALPLTLAGETLTVAREKAAEMLSWLGLGSFLYKMPTILSGGQRQRVAMARAIINDPEIILADEPTGHVDDENAMKIMALFESLHKKGKTVILATHNRLIMDSFDYPTITIENGMATVTKEIKSTVTIPIQLQNVDLKTKAKLPERTFVHEDNDVQQFSKAHSLKEDGFILKGAKNA